MRSPALLFTSLLFLLPLAGQAQDDDTIHVVTTLRDDGSKIVTRFDPANHTSDASTYDARDHLLERVIYTLDEGNQPASGIVYTPNNKPAFKTAYKRDAAQRILEEDDYTLDDQLIRRFVYEYSGAKLARIRAFDSQGNEMQQAGTAARKDVKQGPPHRRH